MNILPRIEWTAESCRINVGTDYFSDLPYYRNPPVGIKFIAVNSNIIHTNTDPRKFFKEDLNFSLQRGKSDICYNLGVAGNVDGIWNLRGLHNKSAYSSNPTINDTLLTVRVLCGTGEKPSDQLLRNILDARRLVLSRYPRATEIAEFSGNPYLREILSKDWFWNGGSHSSPVGIYLPDFHLEVGMQNVQVQELQNALAYWGYYKVRVDGIYNLQTIDAVTQLASDLKVGGYYHYQTDGIFSDRLRRAWLKFIEG